VIAAVAEAPPGGVAVHCVDGPDRTGLIAVLLLALVGVERQEILADYAPSDECMARAWAEQGYAGYAEEMASFLAGRGTSAAELLTGLLEDVDLEARLHAGGLADAHLAGLRERLIRP
jgi:protein-tyrosine phosphatase